MKAGAAAPPPPLLAGLRINSLGYEAPVDFDFTGCNLTFPATEYTHPEMTPQVHLRAQDAHISPCSDLARSLGLLGRV